MERRSDTLGDAIFDGTSGILVAYDVTQRKTFEEIPHWLEEARKRSGDNVSIVLVGNKTDLDDMRQVSETEGKELAEQFNVQYLEVSARENENVKKAFHMLIRDVVNRFEKHPFSRLK